MEFGIFGICPHTKLVLLRGGVDLIPLFYLGIPNPRDFGEFGEPVPPILPLEGQIQHGSVGNSRIEGSRGGFIPFPGILPTPPMLWDDEDPKFRPRLGKIQLDFVVLKKKPLEIQIFFTESVNKIKLVCSLGLILGIFGTRGIFF